MQNKNKLYILVDSNLEPIYGSVQGGHAVAQWLLENYEIMKNGDPNWSWKNDYLIYVSSDIKKWTNRLMRYDPSIYRWSSFEEPDLGNKTTAIAIYERDFPPIIQRKLKREKLLKRELPE